MLDYDKYIYLYITILVTFTSTGDICYFLAAVQIAHTDPFSQVKLISTNPSILN